LEERRFLMGYKGESLMDSGYFYCPYIDLVSSPVVKMPEPEPHPEEGVPLTVPPKWEEEAIFEPYIKYEIRESLSRYRSENG